LGRLCEGHPSLERETRALLRAADAAPVEELVEGAVLGDYRLVEKLGVGGTASVWRAFDRHLQAWTALKVLHPRKGDALDAVLREARAASAIISDHVVRIRTAGRTPSGRSFIEMQLAAEYRRGEDGAEVLVVGRSLADAPPDGERDLARCVAEAARGVDAAHRVGVLHRDLKPANLLRLPVSRRVLVTDFGLAVAPCTSRRPRGSRRRPRSAW
jgi:serine/threonine-protein kinase